MTRPPRPSHPVPLSEFLYLISSCCFLAGAGWAFCRTPSPIELLSLLGSVFFLLAAATNVWRSLRGR